MLAHRRALSNSARSTHTNTPINTNMRCQVGVRHQDGMAPTATAGAIVLLQSLLFPSVGVSIGQEMGCQHFNRCRNVLVKALSLVVGLSTPVEDYTGGVTAR